MLRRLLGVGAGVAALTAVPVSFQAPEAGGVPAPVVSDLSCTEDVPCCYEPGSICMASGYPETDRREANKGTCK